MAKKETNGGVFALEFIGSLFYLFVVYELISGAVGMNALFSGTGAFWLPVFVSLSVLTSIILFFYSFTYLAPGRTGIKLSGCTIDGAATAIAGFTLVALTFANVGYLALTLIGFIIAFIGVIMAEYRK
ncbi:MAG: hypothetical protein M1360_03615 [Candidatus Marsarchaeota archaeon]|jgi:hypothetical protein|nr:hypothetical protein [Candidatus Marsarchaeota archaeon]MCL5419000.1 hypothetical protein [Candidatus Marsarchaeota archaeon]